jgi:nitrogen fixation/metabolism regulation signal transduction histidine kinase
MDDIKLMNTVWFVFFAGTLDILMTVAVILLGVGYEINPMYTWIQSNFEMFMFMLAINLLTCLIFIPLLQRHQIFYLGAYGWGITRMVIGFWAGFVILVGL